VDLVNAQIQRADEGALEWVESTHSAFCARVKCAAASRIVRQHLAKCLDAPIVHVRSRESDVAQRRGLETTHVEFPAGGLETAGVARRVVSETQVVEAGVVELQRCRLASEPGCVSRQVEASVALGAGQARREEEFEASFGTC